MKLKIKLRENKLNEAVPTPGLNALRDIEAQKATDEYDPDELEAETEKNVNKVENIKSIKATLKKNNARN